MALARTISEVQATVLPTNHETMKEMIMKLQMILKSLVLIAVLLASAFVSYSSVTATRGSVSPAPSLCPSEVKSDGFELASTGFQVGNA